MKLLFVFVAAFIAGALGLRESYTGRQRLVGYWGQNGAGPSFGKPNWEKPLDVTCQTTKFDIIVMAFMDIFWDTRQNNLPDLNFAFHCGTPISPKYPFLLRCPQIEAHIGVCQKLGKKVLLSLGGATGDGTLPSKAKAQELAQEVWDMFLDGNKMDGTTSLRPFGNAILDGLDFDIEGGSGPANYQYLFKELRMLMDSDPKKTYLITGAPQCPYPDRLLGPGPGTGLGEAGNDVDILWIQFYNNYCYPGSKKFFQKTLNQWLDYANNVKPRGPEIFIGLPAHPRASSGARFYMPPAILEPFYEGIRDMPGIGGIMLWDASWDQNNVINGRRYSEYAYDALRKSYDPTTAPPPPETTTAAPGPLPTTGPPVPFTCVGQSDGLYPYPNNCHKFIICAGGREYDESCPPGTKFDANVKICQWDAKNEC